MYHYLRVESIVKKSINIEERHKLVNKVNYDLFGLIKKYGGPKYPSLKIWVGLTTGWNYELVVKDLSANKTVAIKCKNELALKDYIIKIMEYGVHSIPEDGEDCVLKFYDTEDQLSMK